MTPFVTTRRVEFGDTDMAGIVHFSNFFRYMEAAETDFLLARGLTVSWLDGGVKWGFPRVSAACDYKTPARFGDLLSITVAVEKVGSRSVTYRHDFAVAGREVATGRITAVFCKSTPTGIESCEMPAEIRLKLSDAVNANT